MSGPLHGAAPCLCRIEYPYSAPALDTSNGLCTRLDINAVRGMATASSAASVVSIEPAIARQITISVGDGPADASRPEFSRSLPAEIHIVATEKRPRKRPSQDDWRGADGVATSQEANGRPRNNSLRRVKNSKELLRERSLKRNVMGGTDAHATSKEGRNFTVGKVGTGGLIYLRPSTNQTKPTTQTLPFVFAPLTPPQTASMEPDWQNLSGDNSRKSVWSTSQLSEKLAQPFMQDTAGSANRYAFDAVSQPRHGRARSFSSTEHCEQSDTEGQGGTLRIVINRSAGKQSRTADKIVQPTLEVPIPHYRIGTPRFSIQGTPILRSSAYSRISEVASHDVRSSIVATPKLLFPVPNTPYTKTPRSRPLSDIAGHAGQTFAGAHARRTVNPASSSADLNSGTRAPVDAALFDDLTQKQDDPSVVRYSLRTGGIVAATPARIIAQISSASFMDYELVSDFFLTFRSYLSTNEVLDLLLARLRWAINRLEDDGRIIRIRTFAALRHWILNYFMDDFVTNRKLRVEFCDQINDMYHKVQGRTGGGTSDLKILQDLKRCWNGRCSLYWDSDDFVIDSQQEADIVPGGVVGSRDSSLTRLHVPVDPLADTEQDSRQDRRRVTESWFEVPPQDRSQHLHRRPDPITSATPAEAPVSIGSEKSLQPISCSIPTTVLRRSPRLQHGTKEHHPVPSSSRRQLSPSAPVPAPKYNKQSASHAHKRSGSFTDSLRDRKSDHSINQDFMFVLPHAGSIIRGNVIPPGSPYIDLSSKASKPQEHNAHEVNQSLPAASTNDGLGIHIGPNNGVKTLIGSIRRALSTRQGVQAHDPGPTKPAQPFRQGRKSPLPLNITRSNDALRDKAVTSSNRTLLRIDLLCATISHSYQMAQDQMRHSEMTANHGPAEMSDMETPSAVPQGPAYRVGDELKSTRRLVSQATAQSGSIMIVDDTGLDFTSMSGAFPVPMPTHNDTFAAVDPNSTTDAVMSMSQSTYLGLPSTPSASRRSSGVFARRRSNSLDTGVKELGPSWTEAEHRNSRAFSQKSVATQSFVGTTRKHQSTATAATAIRRSVSYHGGMVRHEPGDAAGRTLTNAYHKDQDTEDSVHLPSHVLRRRPGGDLRKIQNVHDLDTGTRRESNLSGSSDSDSVGGSLVIMANRPKDSNAAVRPRSARRSVSLIHTHSSQHLRPSFEAAVSGFSTIPDDDDGGLEATLLKLEGRYEKRSPSTNAASPPSQQEEWPVRTQLPGGQLNGFKRDKTRNESGNEHAMEANTSNLNTSAHFLTTIDPISTKRGVATSSRRSSIYGLPTESIAGSDDSYNSVPLFERGATDDSLSRHAFPHSKPAISIPRPLFLESTLKGQVPSESSHPSIEVVEETASMRDIPQGCTVPVTDRSPTAHSFLLDADENLSDLSSELSVDIINYSEVLPRNPSPLLAAPGTALSGLEIPSHPLAHPPSPSFTLQHLATPQSMNPMMFQKPPLTPDPSPTQNQQPFSKMYDHLVPAKEVHMSANSPSASPTDSAHMAWILAYDSELVAEQMTLVEQAALTEIDWSDLVNMRWDNSAAPVLNWVDFLSAGDGKGIDLVITRFNIMVKWTLSEIVLTREIHERAQTIMKYIHLAAHARRLHNYATMLQITIALTSSDCSRLRKTWELVHPPERSLLKNMEALIQPLRNFHDLRVEMETADLTEGCIPFVGLYIHDLTYNAQKPAEIFGAPNNERLINFERYRTTAAIVKGLLRLIDASSRYNYPPVEGVLDRCLWMAALSDERIHALSRSLEP